MTNDMAVPVHVVQAQRFSPAHAARNLPTTHLPAAPSNHPMTLRNKRAALTRLDRDRLYADASPYTAATPGWPDVFSGPGISGLALASAGVVEMQLSNFPAKTVRRLVVVLLVYPLVVGWLGPPAAEAGDATQRLRWGGGASVGWPLDWLISWLWGGWGHHQRASSYRCA